MRLDPITLHGKYARQPRAADRQALPQGCACNPHNPRVTRRAIESQSTKTDTIFFQIGLAAPKAARQQVMPDDHSEVEPPLPIPNRTVKRLCADDSEQLARESRSSSGKLLKTKGQLSLAFCFWKGRPWCRPSSFDAAPAPRCRVAVSSWCLRNGEHQLDRVKKKRHNLASLLMTNLMSCQRRDL